MKEQFVTKEKLEELKAQLQNLKTDKRFDIAERLKKAKEHGDLSENFEYAQAKEDQEKLEIDILNLEALIKDAKIITKSRNKDIVSIGSIVALKNKKGTIKYTIVGSQDADPFSNKISNSSAIGKAILGKKVKDKIIVKTPKGDIVEFEIITIE